MGRPNGAYLSVPLGSLAAGDPGAVRLGYGALRVRLAAESLWE